MEKLILDTSTGNRPLELQVLESAATSQGFPPMAFALAALSLGAAVIHGAFAPAHFEEAWKFGAFFVACTWLQLAHACVLVNRTSRWVYLAGCLNVAVIATWLVSRTVGIPFGPDPGVAETIGLPDLVCTVFEVLIVFGCVSMVVGTRPRWLGEWTRRATYGVVGSLFVVVALTTASLMPRFAETHEHSDPVAVTDGPHDPAMVTGPVGAP